MIMAWLRGIIQPADDPRIACLMARMRRLEIEKDALMARLDDLTAVIVEVGGAVDALISNHGALAATVAAGEDDPRLVASLDNLRAIRDRIVAAVPAPAPVVDPAPAG